MLVTTKVVLSILSGLVFVYAFFPYINAIARGQASPRKATRLVWALGDIIMLAGMLAKSTTSGLIIAATLGAITVFLLSLKYGELGWNRRDKVCITLSLIAIALWVYCGESNIGIALSLVALAIPQLVFADAAPPIVFAAVDAPMLFLLFVRPHLQKRALQTS